MIRKKDIHFLKIFLISKYQYELFKFTGTVIQSMLNYGSAKMNVKDHSDFKSSHRNQLNDENQK